MVKQEINESGCVRRATHQTRGRANWLSPESAAVRNLHYGRIVLTQADSPLSFSTANRETGLVCLAGSAAVKADDLSFDLAPYDSLYVPRDTAIEIAPGPGGCDFAEVS